MITFSKKMINILNIIFPDWSYIMERECKDMQSILDLGCGYNSLVRFTKIPQKTGVDIFQPYIEESRKKNIHNSYILADIRKISFPEKSFDVVFSSELIEHLEKKDGEQILYKAEKIAKKKIIITTPNGFLDQKEYHNNNNQEHKSGWTVYDFKKRGYKVYGINGLKFLRGQRGEIIYRPIFLFRLILILSKTLVYFFPGLAFQLMAVKILNHD